MFLVIHVVYYWCISGFEHDSVLPSAEVKLISVASPQSVALSLLLIRPNIKWKDTDLKFKNFVKFYDSALKSIVCLIFRYYTLFDKAKKKYSSFLSPDQTN